jgi:hypothetical protein
MNGGAIAGPFSGAGPGGGTGGTLCGGLGWRAGAGAAWRPASDVVAALPVAVLVPELRF